MIIYINIAMKNTMDIIVSISVAGVITVIMINISYLYLS